MPATLLAPNRVAVPRPASGLYVITGATGVSNASNTLGNNTLRVYPWPVETALAIDRIGAEVTVVGEAGSKLRLGIYADTGYGYPGALLLDAGQIAGDSATVQELTCSLRLAPGLYWIGGVVQSASTTQPTVRVCNTSLMITTMTGSTAPGNTSSASGYSMTASGALAATFATSPSGAGQHPRVFVRLA